MNRSAPRIHRRTLFTLVALLALAGCKPHMRGPVEPREDIYPWPQIMLADTDLPRQIAVRKPVVERDPAGLVYVTVPIRSTTRHEITIEYRSTFYDRERTPIFQSTWFPITMTPFTQTTFSVNSTDNRAEDFQIDIRRAK